VEEKKEDTTEIEETMGLKMVDNFEELNLNPDLLRGIYGTPPPT
jgi:superfamily II DNA/RNA helicase